MKYILILTLFIYNNLSSQNSIDSIPNYLKLTQTDSVYLQAIEKYTLHIDSLYSRQNRKKNNIKIIYVQNEDFLFKIPSKVNGYEIIKLGFLNRKKYFRQNKSRLTYVVISPISIEKNSLFVSFIPYQAKLKGRKKLFLEYSNWTKIYFKLKNNKVDYIKTINDGI